MYTRICCWLSVNLSCRFASTSENVIISLVQWFSLSSFRSPSLSTLKHTQYKYFILSLASVRSLMNELWIGEKKYTTGTNGNDTSWLFWSRKLLPLSRKNAVRLRPPHKHHQRLWLLLRTPATALPLRHRLEGQQECEYVLRQEMRVK